MPEGASDEIMDLLEEAPDGEDLAVHGHTDSVVGAVEL